MIDALDAKLNAETFAALLDASTNTNSFWNRQEGARKGLTAMVNLLAARATNLHVDFKLFVEMLMSVKLLAEIYRVYYGQTPADVMEYLEIYDQLVEAEYLRRSLPDGVIEALSVFDEMKPLEAELEPEHEAELEMAGAL